MTDKKLTDNEIKKALECCQNKNDYDCDDCPYQEIKHFDKEKGFEIMPNGMTYDTLSCDIWLQKDTLDYINRLEAENERHKELFEEWKAEAYKVADEKDELYCNAIDRVRTAKAEAYKEFADLSIKRICEQVSAPTPSESYIVEKCNQVIDNLLKEKVGDE